MKIIEALDHPIVFLFFVTIGVLGMTCIIQWVAKSTHTFGLHSAAT